MNISIWSNYFREVINNLKAEGYDFEFIAEMDIITLAHKREMTDGFYLKHNMSAIEWLINKELDKDKALINHFPQNWRHPINCKYRNYRVY